MPLPKPRTDEPRTDFLARCMGDDTARQDFEKPSQRYAVCLSQWARRNKDDETQPQAKPGTD